MADSEMSKRSSPDKRRFSSVITVTLETLDLITDSSRLTRGNLFCLNSDPASLSRLCYRFQLGLSVIPTFCARGGVENAGVDNTLRQGSDEWTMASTFTQ
ncbi:hypothetical protein TNIN_141931 [Trichonephila inaurata madagascariensis]|uniref:Uncharacterized protein n=1 Tax=Trichonephila inaurata madagascariensis TaxID=2747483 RepID=A0A8X6MB00_9ARAC|nr:hypothetical protein TNIN_141931 [Trichonephila inaurata madagascariensis]